MEKKAVGMKKIVITGPESTGKTTLVNAIADQFNVPFVAEFARHYLNELHRPYRQEDLYQIALGQLAWEEKVRAQQPSFLLCDTDLLTIKIWSEYKYNTCDSRIVAQLADSLPLVYVLCKPDLAWEPDVQRENPDDRAHLFDLYEKEIQQLQIPYFYVDGVGKERMQRAMDTLLHFI